MRSIRRYAPAGHLSGALVRGVGLLTPAVRLSGAFVRETSLVTPVGHLSGALVRGIGLATHGLGVGLGVGLGAGRGEGRDVAVVQIGRFDRLSDRSLSALPRITLCVVFAVMLPSAICQGCSCVKPAS